MVRQDSDGLKNWGPGPGHLRKMTSSNENSPVTLFKDGGIKESSPSQMPFPPLKENNALSKKNLVTMLKKHFHTLGPSTLFSDCWTRTTHASPQASFLKYYREGRAEVLPLLTSLWNKGIKQLSQSQQAKKYCNPMTWFQKAHCEPEKQFCIKFFSYNRITDILLVQKRLSILMYHELYINSAYKTCLVGKTCHLLYSSKSIMAANKERLYFTRPKRFLWKFLESRWSAA